MQALKGNRKNGHSARRMRWTRGGLSLFSLLIAFSMALSALGGGALAAGPLAQAQDGTILPETPQAPDAITAIGTGQAWSSLYRGAAYPGTYAYPISAGANRMLVVGISSSRSTAGTQTVSVTYGGQSLTLATGNAGTSAIAHSYLYYLKEAGIVAAANTNLVVSVSGGTSRYNYVYAAVYTGASQASSPITDAQTILTTGSTAIGPFSPTLLVNAGDQAVEMVNLTRTGSSAFYTISSYAANWSAAFAPTGFSDTTNNTGYNAYAVVRTQPASDASEASQHTGSGSTNAIYSMSGMSIRAFPSGGYSYSVAPLGVSPDTGIIPDGSGAGGCGATAFWNVRYFLVNEHFTVTDLNVRFDVTHGTRGQVQMTLTSPPDASGNRVSQVLVATSGDTNNDYDILLDADSTGALNDGSNDTTADPVDRFVNQTLLNSFDNRDAHGAWRMDICDNTANGSSEGTFVGAALYFSGNPIAVTPPTFTQGPAVLETYYVPYPESQLWTAMNTLFTPGRSAATGDDTTNSCLDYFATNSNPRQPMIGYTGVTITQAGTWVYYDHFEDGYEAAISFPAQTTTEVWGDGDLNNGRAPGDADDVLSAGQLIVLNDVKDSAAAEVIDYDGRDKLAATAPVSVTRSAWSNGSTTLYAHADEVYPTYQWGDNYRLPVGENVGPDFFQYSAVMVMAAADGTVIHIDKLNDGTPEVTQTLNQGQVYFWDDSSTTPVNNVIGNGLNRGSRVYSDGGKVIQVSLLTGDVCAGYETRSFTLLPTTAWSSQYYAPASSPSANQTDVYLYNAGASSITVNWTFGTGASSSATVTANSGTSVNVPDGTAARFYSTANFYAVGVVDAEQGTDNGTGASYDWGYTLVPVSAMSSYLIAGWAPGWDPNINSATPATDDTAPIWLTGGHTTTPTSTTAFTVCIDYNGDGGPTTDPITGRTYNATVSVTPFQQQILYDPDYNQTAMQLWVCDATNGTDAVITAAWGEDPGTAPAGRPAMDMGFTIRNLRSWQATKGVALQNDLNGNGLYDEGDTLRYTVEVKNTGGNTIPASTLNVKDTLPSNATYVTSSTYLVDHNNTTSSIADVGGGSPLLGAGVTYGQGLPGGKSFELYMDMTINAGAAPGTVENTATITDGTVTYYPDVTIQIQEPRPGYIGNYVWLDEDGDGDQDAGEAGIPNMKVDLCSDAACTTILATTTTDANGGYIFRGLAAGAYYVRTYPTTNLNQTYDENGVGTANVTMVNLGSGEEHLTADFGYNWSTTGETNTPSSGSTGAIGDRIWVDLDGDGVQDAPEIGIQGVTVELWYDSNGDGVIDAIYPSGGTATTDANGNYLFDSLPKGIYEVRVTDTATKLTGYNQTGDPDHFGTTGTNDSRTTTPILLGPGDVFINADFGYQPSTAQLGSIGDYVWFDADGGADQDASEYGINGVTVSLIKDLDGDGVWDTGEPIIATTLTGDNPATSGVVETGWYQFSGLPTADGLGTDDYLVWVNDTENVLGDLTATYDASAPSNGLSSVLNLTTTAVTSQDFGYTAPDNTPGITGAGQIGDYVWLDADGDGVQDAGEDGIEGVVVRLLDNTGALIAVTVTDENGHYYFADLPVSAGGVDYQVQVATASLPSGLTQTYDFDGVGTTNLSTITLTVANPIRLDQDFGYRGLNTIGGTIWNDSNADGALTEAGRFAGVTVVLKDSNGDIVASTTTDASGNYTFTNLPDGAFTVDVTDDANVLNGYWKSTGPSAGSDNNSQVDPYTVTVNGTVGRTNTTADFGYYQQPAALGNFVWEDLDGDGIQDAGEPGIPGVPVTLTVTWPNSSGTTTLKTTTDAIGYYTFANLLQDEDYPASGGAGQPALSVSITAPAGYASSPQNQTTEDLDSDNPAGEPAAATKGSANNIYDFGLLRNGTIGNYVWLDEDGDTDQDAGEAGIPNAKVQLCSDAACTTVLKTTYTDANGGYLFTDVPRGSYYVKVTPPAGLNPTYDENGGLDNVSAVTLTASGQEYLTADFGYNWSTPTETNNPTLGATGAIGDTLWVDVDGDGVQDAEEVGIPGITVQLTNLGADGVLGTGDDIVTSTTTNANGSYIFDGLSAGSYVVTIPTPPAGFTQTGDPDHFGTTGTNDNKTTTPIVLGPGDVFVNADFGYQPAGGTTGSIGDTLWLDADRAGDIDAAEPCLPGVTVSLIKDTNADGAWDPDGVDNILGNGDDEVIIATDVTDANGQYLFSGLPAGGGQDYLVWVNDSNSVLGGLIPTYDSNGTGTPNISAVTDLTTAGNLLQDFGYAPSGHDAGEGLIGDTVFIDRDADGAFDAGEGLEGVRVSLYDSTGTVLLAVTTTNENGQYFFGNLSPTAIYQVKIDATTLPVGMTNTVDPDGGTANMSIVNLAATGGINLAQDFGYRDVSSPNRIAGTIWNDTNADGSLVGGESGRFAGVTVVLYNSAGNVIGTTITDASGNYSFTNLPDGTYKVDVTDDANVLNGYWKSTGGSPGLDNNSQVDPYTVSVGGGQNNQTADFGYYQQPAALGNFVWEDLDGDGVQDAGEPGIPGVPVTLTVTWPNSSGTTTLKTATDASGFYSFANLLQDEDYPASGGAGQPTLSVSITAPAGYASSPQNATTEDLDSDNPVGEPAAATKGSANNIYDFGLVRNGTIGNYVWLDEDGDTDQDAGEAGIPNATVQLCADAACTTVLKTTTTDANGGYLFTDVPRGSYYVKVTPPAGLNPTYDENGGLDNISTVTLTASGQEYLTADFGYNWSTPTETNNPGPGATGAIGDKVWVDVLVWGVPNGIFDAYDMGLAGVTVELWYDSNGDGTIDALYPTNGTKITDATGSYIFDNLPAGIYEVRVTGGTTGYTQSGDPDEPGVVCTTCDAKTTAPIVLSPGDVYINADFGFYTDDYSSMLSKIGDHLWVDANRNGIFDGGEAPLPGVTVSLIKDTNGDGAWDPDGADDILGNADDEVIQSTFITDNNGWYMFTAVPAWSGQDYLVWVNDTNNVLGDLVPTFDSDGTGTPNISAVPNLTSERMDQDFGYAPSGHDAGEGLIGDTVFLDLNNNGSFDAGEGVEGVVVKLFASDGITPVATTVTNENGQYFFGNLNPTATYVVQVQTATLPYSGLTNTVDPDGGAANQSTVNLATTGPVNLAQDFGYRDTSSPNTISGTIWKDSNADGALTEPGRFQGVTVALLDNNGNVIATTTTDASGNYSFTNLPDGTYKVDVTDDNNVLNGYWKSNGTNPGADNNSQVDPYTVSVSGGQNNATADFGYYLDPAALGNWVWVDDGDGIQESGENPIADWPVTLTITYPNGVVVTLQTATDANGYYNFANLLQDEDYDGAGAGEPTFTVTVPIPTDGTPSPANQGGNDALDSDGTTSGSNVTASVTAGNPLVKGATNPDYDFGFVLSPTNLTVSDPYASVANQSIEVNWQTYSEMDILGFSLYRAVDPNTAPADRSLVMGPTPAKHPGKPLSDTYQYVDSDVQPGVSYTYWLVVQMKDGTSWTMQPTTAGLPELEKKVFLPKIQR